MNVITVDLKNGTVQSTEKIYLHDTLRIVVSGLDQPNGVILRIAANHIAFAEIPSFTADAENIVFECLLYNEAFRRGFLFVHRHGSRVFDLEIARNTASDGKLFSGKIRIYNRIFKLDGSMEDAIQEAIEQHISEYKHISVDGTLALAQGWGIVVEGLKVSADRNLLATKDELPKDVADLTDNSGKYAPASHNHDQVYASVSHKHTEYLNEEAADTLIGQKIKEIEIPAGKSAYEIAVDNGFVGTEGDWLQSLHGKDGADGKDGQDGAPGKDGVDGKDGEPGKDGTDGQDGAPGKDGQDGAPGKDGQDGKDGEPGKDGTDGQDGKSAYDIAVSQGYSGTVDEWLQSLVGPSGQDLKIDATGKSLSDRDLYAASSKGFSFAYSEIDETERKTTIHIYVKKSNALDDWSGPMDVVWFSGEDGENVKFIARTRFASEDNENPPSGAVTAVNNCIEFECPPFPDSAISSVSIDTEDGELFLGTYAENGVTRIVKTNDGKYRVYLGNLPEWKTGWIYYSQGMAEKTLWLLYQENGGKFEYSEFCRKIFELIDQGATSPEEPETPGKIYYGCVNDGTTYKVSQITADMLEGDTVTEADAGAITATLAQTMGGVLFVLVPADSGLAVKKDDGVGGKVPFDEDIGAAGTGANGIDITLNGTAYKAYGEFSLIDAETVIYIEGE